MALPRLRNLGSLTRIGTALSSSVSETLGRSSTLGLPIAIEFGAGSLKILQIAAGEPPTLVAAACIDTPDDYLIDPVKRLKFQLEALPRLIRHGGFKGRRAVCAIPAAGLMCKHATLTRVEGVPLDTQVAESLPGLFGMDASLLVHRYSEVPAVEPGAKVDAIVTAVPRDVVERLMLALGACKLQPVGMHGAFSAVLRTFDHVHRRAADLATNTIYLDIGAASTNVMISHGKDLAFARTVQIGGLQLDQLICRQIKCELPEARKVRLAGDAAFKPAAAPAAAEPRVLVTPDGGAAVPDSNAPDKPAFTPPRPDATEAIEALTDEVLMCLRYHEGQFPAHRVDRAIFVGGEARHRGLCTAVARALRLPAQMADPLARVARTGSEPAVGLDLRQSQPGWAVALGLCLSPTDL